MSESTKTAKDVLDLIKNEDVKVIDLRFMDFPGLWQHFSVPTREIEMMCNANMHIGQMYGIVEIESEDVADALKELDPEIALNLIKEAKYSFPKGKVEQFKRLFTKIQIGTKLKEQNNVCAICKNGKEKYEGDHIIPWSKGGKTNDENLQVLCISCHQNKIM